VRGSWKKLFCRVSEGGHEPMISRRVFRQSAAKSSEAKLRPGHVRLHDANERTAAVDCSTRTYISIHMQ
jgi:hypothetical protein